MKKKVFPSNLYTNQAYAEKMGVSKQVVCNWKRRNKLELIEINGAELIHYPAPKDK